MRSLPVTALLVGLVLMLSGCGKSLSQDKADAVLKGLATELVKMEGVDAAEKMTKVKAVCEKEGVEVEALARYLEANPSADKKLAELMQKAFEEDLQAKQKAYADELEKVEADAKKAAADRKAEILGKKQELENATQAKIAEMEATFEKQQKELQNTIAEVRKQQ